ncbi:3116_t:CDS:1, partial [Cetraspora pellucida]
NTVVCHDKNFIDISFSGKWNNSKVESVGLSKSLDTKHPFFQDLYKAYDDYLNSKAALINKKLEFYNSIMYTVLEDNQDPVRVKLKV